MVEHLEAQGAELIERNLRVGGFELDIVARMGELVMVVEVRTRGTSAWESGFASIHAEKARRVRRAGEALWRQRFSGDPTVNRMRFDVASVVFTGEGARVEYARGVL